MPVSSARTSSAATIANEAKLAVDTSSGCQRCIIQLKLEYIIME